MAKLKIDINLVSFDDLLEMIGLFSDVDTEDLKNNGIGEIVNKYKPLMSYFVIDENGKRLQKEQALIEVGSIPAVDILPQIPILIKTITELTGLMSLPPVSSGKSRKHST